MKDNPILKKTLDEINKKYGKGATISFSDDKIKGVEFISSGSLSLDFALGGGYAQGRIIEIYSPDESSGKTTLAIHAAVEAQKKFPDKVVGYIDSEQAFDPFYGKALGLDYSDDKWVFSQPSNAEEAFDIAEMLIESGIASMVIFDSVAAMIPKAELEGDFGDSKMGLQARLMSQAMRKLTGIIKKSDCVTVFINQMRDNLGITFGNSKVTTGGNALKFYTSQRIETNRSNVLKDGEETTGIHIKARIKKNKVAAPFKVAEFDILFGEGIDFIGEIVDLATQAEIIKKSGSWFSYGEVRLGQGRENVRIMMKDNPELLEEVTKKLKINLGF